MGLDTKTKKIDVPYPSNLWRHVPSRSDDIRRAVLISHPWPNSEFQHFQWQQASGLVVRMSRRGAGEFTAASCCCKGAREHRKQRRRRRAELLAVQSDGARGEAGKRRGDKN